MQNFLNKNEHNQEVFWPLHASLGGVSQKKGECTKYLFGTCFNVIIQPAVKLLPVEINIFVRASKIWTLSTALRNEYSWLSCPSLLPLFRTIMHLPFSSNIPCNRPAAKVVLLDEKRVQGGLIQSNKEH